MSEFQPQPGIHAIIIVASVALAIIALVCHHLRKP